jgi:hypothetical protein
MSKSGRKSAVPAPQPSLLRAASDAAERGDALTARRLASAVLAGRKTSEDEHAALDLAKELASEDHAVHGTPDGVALELLRRTSAPAKAYAFALLSGGLLLLLVALARARYGG